MSEEISAGNRNSGNNTEKNVNAFQKDFIQMIPLPAFIKSKQNVLLDYNTSFAHLLNIQDASSMLNQPFNKLTLHSHLDTYHDEVLSAEGNPVHYEDIYLDEHGDEHLINIHKSLIPSVKDDQYQIFGVITGHKTNTFSHASSLPNEIPDILKNDDTPGLMKSKEALEHHMQQLDTAWISVRSNEQRIETVLTALKAGAWEWQPKTKKLLWSKQCFEIFGLPFSAHFSKEQWISHVYPSDLERVIFMWDRILNQYGWFEFEFRILKNNGITWIRKSGQYLKDIYGVEKVIGVMTDISDEKFVQERLFDRHEFLKGILEDQPEIICRVQPSDKISFVNQAFCNFFELSYSELIQQPFSRLLQPSDYAKIKRLLQLSSPKNPVLNFEQSIKKPNNERATIQWTLRALFDAENFLSEYQLVGRDITDIETSRNALEKSEAMFRMLTENSTDIISLHHQTKGIVEYISPSVTKILGYDATQIINADIFELVYPDDHEIIKQVKNHFIRSKETLSFEIRLLNKSNQPIWFEIIVQPQWNSDELYTGSLIAVSRNINTRKNIEQQRLQAEKELMEANASKDKFFSIIAHDLRSPFTAILGFSRLLDEDYETFDDEDRKSMIKQILTSTENTFQLLDNLLVWARAQLNQTKCVPEKFQIMSLVRETLSLSWPQAQAKQIDLLVRSASDYVVLADINMIKTVLRNLVSNAIKYSYTKSSVELNISASEDMVNITVSDHGTGMDENTLKNLFNADQRLESVKGTLNEKGTGLGLILAKEFVERNNGKIGAISEPGKGSQFNFTLPRVSGE
ncbi:MAG: PAS domain S-box protein [Lentimicrobiaceae bacterium]|nr:PAS domain S-box protein [Lentimicrobiaceae bacterium]